MKVRPSVKPICEFAASSGGKGSSGSSATATPGTNSDREQNRLWRELQELTSRATRKSNWIDIHFRHRSTDFEGSWPLRV